MPGLSRLASAVAFLWVLPVTFFAYFSLFQPWPAARQALADLGPGPRIVVSMSVQGSADGASSRSQTFLVLPASLWSYEAYEVSQVGGRVRVSAQRNGLFIYGGFYVIWIATSIWYVRRRGLIPSRHELR